jgi:hypothetical protein
VHELAMDLDSAAAAIQESLEEDRMLGRSGLAAMPASWHVKQEFSTHVHDITDVLNECVAPKLDAWVAAEAWRSLSH